MKDVALQLKNVGKSYGNKVVLESIDFEVRHGSMVALLGTSGAGKSTLFRCLTGLEPIDSGSIVALGESIHELSPARLRAVRGQIGFVFQQLHLVKRFSALENVLGARLAEMPIWRVTLKSFSRADKVLAFECLDRVGMLDYANTPTQLLSGGQQQRIAIARALAQKPKIIIADEPVSSLDPLTARSVLQTLKAAATDLNVAVLCSLHQVDLALEVSDRVVGLRDGRISLNMANQPNDQGMMKKARSIYQQRAVHSDRDEPLQRHVA